MYESRRGHRRLMTTCPAGSIWREFYFEVLAAVSRSGQPATLGISIPQTVNPRPAGARNRTTDASGTAGLPNSARVQPLQPVP